MKKLMVLAAVPLLAAVSGAEAGEAGRVTFVDRVAGIAVIDNAVRLAGAYDVRSFRVGDSVAVLRSAKGDGGAARLVAFTARSGKGAAPSAPTVERAVDGRLTFVDAAAGRAAIDNQPIRIAAGTDLSRLGLGQTVRAIVVGKDGMESARSVVVLAPRGPVAAMSSVAKTPERHAAGHITFIDRAARRVLVNNAWLTMPDGLEAATLRVGDRVDARYVTADGINRAVRISVTG